MSAYGRTVADERAAGVAAARDAIVADLRAEVARLRGEASRAPSGSRAQIEAVAAARALHDAADRAAGVAVVGTAVRR